MTFCSFVSYSSFNHICKCLDSTANRAIFSLLFQYLWRALYACVSCLSTVCHALVFPMPLLCQSLCVICRQLEVCGNRDLLLFSHMPLSIHPSSFLLSRHLCLFVCLHVKAVALVSLTHTHSPSSYYVY